MARTVISCIVMTCILSVTQWDAGTLLYGKPPHKQQKILLQSIGQTQIRVDEEDLPKSFYKFSLNKFIDTYKRVFRRNSTCSWTNLTIAPGKRSGSKVIYSMR